MNPLSAVPTKKLLALILSSSALFSPSIVLALDSPSSETQENIKHGVEERLVDVERKAVASKRSNESPAEAFGREAQASAKRGEEYLETLTGAHKEKFAATVYLGFYYSNLSKRPEFCRQIGVSLDRWRKAFTDAHEIETSKARKIYIDAGVEPSSVEKMLPDGTIRIVEEQFRDLAAKIGGAPRDACAAFDKEATSFVSQLHFSKIFPRADKTLQDAR